MMNNSPKRVNRQKRTDLQKPHHNKVDRVEAPTKRLVVLARPPIHMVLAKINLGL